jgi:hypothetical protein
VTRIVATAELPVSRERASQVILDPKTMERWLSGATQLRADQTWPHFGAHLSWETEHGQGFCDAKVIDYSLPDFVRVEVATPHHARIVTHRFSTLPNGGSKYERIVEAEAKGLRRLLGPLALNSLRHQIDAEVKMAASLVTAAPTNGGRSA